MTIKQYSVKKKYMENSDNSKMIDNTMFEDVKKDIDGIISSNYQGSTVSGVREFTFQKLLSIDVDIFEELPKEIYCYSKVKHFLLNLKDEISYRKLDNTTLSKLHVTEFTDNSLTLEWVFGYFRVFFSFELNQDDENDFYGLNGFAPNDDKITNVIGKLNISKYDMIVKNIVDYVVMMGEFEMRDVDNG